MRRLITRLITPISATSVVLLCCSAAVASPLRASMRFHFRDARHLTATITASPARRVTGTWSVNCAGATTSGRYTTQSSVLVPLTLPSNSSHRACVLRFAGSMRGDGRIFVRAHAAG